MRKNTVEQGRAEMTIWPVRFACSVSEVTQTHTHSEYVIPIAFPLQPWLQENASMLCFLSIVCLVIFGTDKK